MANKTCGECKHYNDAMFHCEKFDCMSEDSWSCPDCEEKEKPKPTNGDVIRQMSNEELVDSLIDICHKFFVMSREAVLSYLNAPAEARWIMIQTDNTVLAVAQALIALRDKNNALTAEVERLKAENAELRYIVDKFKNWSAEGGCPNSHNPDSPCWWEQHRFDEDCTGYCTYDDEATHGCWVEYYRWLYRQNNNTPATAEKGGEDE